MFLDYDMVIIYADMIHFVSIYIYLYLLIQSDVIWVHSVKSRAQYGTWHVTYTNFLRPIRKESHEMNAFPSTP